MSANLKVAQDKWEHAWRGFAPGIWRDRVNTRDFIQRNYTPYEGDGSFLKGPTPRTTKMWETLGPLFAKEREKGVLDVSQVPSRLHRQGERTHRRPADRRAPEARDHAERRLARSGR